MIKRNPHLAEGFFFYNLYKIINDSSLEVKLNTLIFA